MKHIPKSPEEFQKSLLTIFPTFAQNLEEDELAGYEAEPATYHSLMRDFSYYFGKHINTFTDKQLRSFAELVIFSTAHEGSLKNAISTCFLEHMHQTKVSRQLQPWIKRAKAKLGA